MSAGRLLDTLQGMGAVVAVDGGDLLIDAITELPDALLIALRAHKSEMIALLSVVAANDDRTGAAAAPLAAHLDTDALAVWLRSEALCLVLRDGLLTFTGPNTQDFGKPSAALRQHVEAHRAALFELLNTNLNSRE